MRVGIFARHENAEAGALCAGFSLAGHRVAMRSLSDYGDGQVERFDLIVVTGLRGRGAACVRDHAASGIPALVVDFGYMARDVYYQVGLGGLNRIPEFACPADRFNALGLTVHARGGDPEGYVLVLGQVPGDAAHGMDDGALRAWVESTLEQYPGARYRPHPLGGEPVDGTLAEALAGARLVVTWNSNAGHEALLAGVPVIAYGPAAYAELAGPDLPSVAERRAYFERLAYAQWTLAEMADGTATRFLVEHLLPGRPVEFAAPAAEPVKSPKRRRARGA
ncbi:MAG: hypothetical protein GX856_08755 [Gammaproteobacteria bacterium]|nr:hypothetical protein [Gammaproteobacteria bacterium]